MFDVDPGKHPDFCGRMAQMAPILWIPFLAGQIINGFRLPHVYKSLWSNQGVVDTLLCYFVIGGSNGQGR